MPTNTYDALVIGSGITGGWAAKELTEKGLNVLVLEAGRTIVPERVYFYSRAQRSNAWTVIVDMDQSGSMAASVVYGAVCGAIFASLPALDTHVVVFGTEVVDLTEKCGNDPVDMLFGVQLGGGTDINKSVAYCEKFITDPRKTLFILITDLFERDLEARRAGLRTFRVPARRTINSDPSRRGEVDEYIISNVTPAP